MRRRFFAALLATAAITAAFLLSVTREGSPARSATPRGALQSSNPSQSSNHDLGTLPNLAVDPGPTPPVGTHLTSPPITSSVAASPGVKVDPSDDSAVHGYAADLQGIRDLCCGNNVRSRTGLDLLVRNLFAHGPAHQAVGDLLAVAGEMDRARVPEAVLSDRMAQLSTAVQVALADLETDDPQHLGDLVHYFARASLDSEKQHEVVMAALALSNPTDHAAVSRLVSLTGRTDKIGNGAIAHLGRVVEPRRLVQLVGGVAAEPQGPADYQRSASVLAGLGWSLRQHPRQAEHVSAQYERALSWHGSPAAEAARQQVLKRLRYDPFPDSLLEPLRSLAADNEAPPDTRDLALTLLERR